MAIEKWDVDLVRSRFGFQDGRDGGATPAFDRGISSMRWGSSVTHVAETGACIADIGLRERRKRMVFGVTLLHLATTRCDPLLGARRWGQLGLPPSARGTSSHVPDHVDK